MTLAQIKTSAKALFDGSKALSGNMTTALGQILTSLVTIIVGGKRGVPVAITNKATGGNIGTAAATVDIASIFLVNQTTANQTLTIPSPTDTTQSIDAIIVNVGSAAFIVGNSSIAPSGGSKRVLWDGVAWRTSSSTAFTAFTNTGTTNYKAPIATANIAGGGVLGTAAATVDIATLGTLNQTTAGQAITLPSPTAGAASVAQVFKLKNIGSASFTFYGQTVAANGGVGEAWWTGSAWI